MKIVLATRNIHKVRELRQIFLGLDTVLLSLEDYPDVPGIAEDGKTFLENATKKAIEAARWTGQWALADDSGLEVRALGGLPGVNSARFAGKHGDYQANNVKLINEMKNLPDEKRGAAFVCAMVLAAPDGRKWETSGRCSGTIGRKPIGTGGFGYDPLFFVPDKGKTMAELSDDEKHEISHRGRAARKMREIIEQILKSLSRF